MKNIFKYFIATIAAACLAVPAFAQGYSAIKTSKNVTPNADGSYTLTLETFVTGEADSRTTITTSSVPLDIVLVLDVSGSMANKITSTSTEIVDGYYQTKDNLATVYENYKSKNYYLRTVSWSMSGVTYNYDPITSMTKRNNGRYRINGGNNDYDNANSIYEYGPHETTVTSTQTKMKALQVAVENFINTVAAQSTDDCKHQIAIVKFAGNNRNAIGNDKYSDGGNRYNYSQIVTGLTELTEANTQTLISTVNSLTAAGATSADYGMAHANTIINGIPQARKDVSKKLVVMFTDGDPNHNSGFDTSVANSTIASSKSLKDNDAIVYTVGVFNGDENSNTPKYMDYVSSNYPNAESMTNTGSRAQVEDENHNIFDVTKYYMTAQSADELNNVFATISEESEPDESDAADIQLTVEAVTVRDIVTESFVIPEGNNAIAFQVANALTIDDSDPSDIKYTWGTPSAAPASVTYKTSTTKTEKGVQKNLDVKGFDFSANWVGFKKYYQNDVEQESRREVKGSKLIITITILPDPTAEGGPVKTNDPNSGVYINGENQGAPVVTYDVPETQFTPMDLKIVTSGLAAGESSIFVITRSVAGKADEEFSMTVALTSVDGEDVATTLSKLPVKDGDNLYEYTVTPTDWAWKYNVVTTDESASHTLYMQTGEDTYQSTNEFNFKATAKTSAKNNAENNKNNQFKVK